MTFESSCVKQVSKVGLVTFHPPRSVDQDAEITEPSPLGSNVSCPRVEQLISSQVHEAATRAWRLRHVPRGKTIACWSSRRRPPRTPRAS